MACNAAMVCLHRHRSASCIRFHSEGHFFIVLRGIRLAGIICIRDGYLRVHYLKGKGHILFRCHHNGYTLTFCYIGNRILPIGIRRQRLAATPQQNHIDLIARRFHPELPHH